MVYLDVRCTAIASIYKIKGKVMDVRHQSVLISNHLNWELSYEDSQPPKETRLSMLACLVGVTVAWPIFFIGGTLMLTFHSCSYIKARWNQYKILNVLSNQKRLQEYSERRIKCCEKQIENLKSLAMFLLEQELKKPAEVGLPIPQKLGVRDHFSSRLPKDYWKDFPWDKFGNTDFFQKSNVPNTVDKNTLQRLEQIRIRINFLSQQKHVLSNPEGRLEAIKKIAEMSFVKNSFKRQEAREWIVHSIIWLFPSGIFLDLYFNSPTNHRLTYEGNKKFLPSGTNLQTYDDLVDAHNKLVRNNNFVVPYIEPRIL